MTDLQTLVDAFAAETGLGQAEPDANGFYHFFNDDGQMSVGPAEDGGIVLLAEVGDVPPEGREQFYRLLLEAMYGLSETKGATFLVVRNTEKILLRQVVSAARAVSEPLADRLNAFADLQAEWSRRIADFTPSIETEDREGAEEGLMRPDVIWV